MATTATYQNAAKRFYDMGFNVIPTQGKRPLCVWDAYQHERQTADQIAEMDWQHAHGVAGICGVNDVVCLDFDHAEMFAPVATVLTALGLSENYTWTVKTPGVGYHIWVRCPGIQLDKGKLDRPGRGAAHVELRHIGHYTVLPGSQHPSGGYYDFVSGQFPMEPPDTVEPEKLIAAYDAVTVWPEPQPTFLPPAPTTSHHNGDGQRNNRYAQAAFDDEITRVRNTRLGGRNDQLNKSAYALGQLVGAGLLNRTDVETALTTAAISVGLGEHETTATIRSGLTDGMGQPRTVPEPKQRIIAIGGDGGDDGDLNESGRNKPKQADILFQLVNERAALFTSQEGERYALVPVDEHRECYALTSKMFREYLDGIYYSQHKTIPGAQAKQDAIGLLSFHARGNKRETAYRVARHEGRVYIDLGNEKWDAVEVDAQGWRIVRTPPVAFRRSSATKPLPYPVEHDNYHLLAEHINIRPEDWVLVATWLIAAAIPGRPCPILAFPNEQGTGKTTNTNRLKALLDPGKGRVLPKEVRDLMVMADNNWLLAFDNVSYITPDVSDALCSIVTAGEFAKRTNYADKDESVIQVSRPIIINGIGNIASDRPDLMQRTLMIRPPLIPAAKRMDEETADARFEADRPRLLGAFLNALSMALRNLPHVRLTEKPRMADYAKIGVAAQQGDFVSAYKQNIENAVSNAAESSPLVEYIAKLVATQRFEGSATRLLDALNSIDGADRVQKSPDWPKSNRTIKNAMQRVAPLLRGVGVRIEHTETKLGSWYVIEQELSR